MRDDIILVTCTEVAILGFLDIFNLMTWPIVAVILFIGAIILCYLVSERKI